MREVLVAREQKKVILFGKACDPDIAYRYRSALSSELEKDASVMVRRLLIGKENFDPRGV